MRIDGYEMSAKKIQTTGMMMMMLNSTMQASICALSGNNSISFTRTRELLNGGPLSLFFNRVLSKNKQLIEISRTYNFVRKDLDSVEKKISNIDFDKIQMESNAENRSKRIIDHAGKVDEINQQVIEITSLLNEAFVEFHQMVSESIKLNQKFIDDYLETIEKTYEKAKKELKIEFNIDNHDVFDISRIQEIRIFAAHHGIDISKIDNLAKKEHMIHHFAVLQVFTQIEYNRLLKKSVNFDQSSEKKSFSSMLVSSVTKSDEKKVFNVCYAEIAELMSRHKDYPVRVNLIKELYTET